MFLPLESNKNYLQGLTHAFDVFRAGFCEQKQNGIQYEARYVDSASGILKRKKVQWFCRSTTQKANSLPVFSIAQRARRETKLCRERDADHFA